VALHAWKVAVGSCRLTSFCYMFWRLQHHACHLCLYGIWYFPSCAQWHRDCCGLQRGLYSQVCYHRATRSLGTQHLLGQAQPLSGWLWVSFMAGCILYMYMHMHGPSGGMECLTGIPTAALDPVRKPLCFAFGVHVCAGVCMPLAGRHARRLLVCCCACDSAQRGCKGCYVLE
jgi:hypothetical protein